MKKLFWIAPPFLIIAGLLCSAGHRLRLVNSDTLYLVAFYRDIFVDHIRLRGYNLGPAPFLFPDLPLLSLCLMLCGEVGAAFTLYSICTVALIAGAFLLIAREISPEKFPRAAAAIFCAALVFVAPLQHERYGLFAFYCLLPSNHGGALLSGIFLCYFALRFRRRAPVYYWPLLFSFVLLGTFSDLFFVPQFVAPLCAAIALFAALRHYPPKSAFSHLATLVLAALLGKYLLHKLDKLDICYIPDAKTQTASADWTARAQDLRLLLEMNPESFLFAACWLIATAIILWQLRKSILVRDRDKSVDELAESRLSFVLVCIALCVGATAALPLLAGIWNNLQHVRYILPLYVLPLFALALGLDWLLRQQRPIFSRSVCAGIILACLLYLIPSALQFRPAQVTLPRRGALDQLLAYAEAHGLKYGWGNYWYARPISVQSDYRLCINEIHPEIYMNNWMNNPNRYFGLPAAMNGREWPDYNFILMNDLDRTRIEQFFGQPRQIVKFAALDDELEIYIYDRKEDVALRNFLRISAFTRSYRQFAALPARYPDLYEPVSNYKSIDSSSNFPIPPGGMTIDFTQSLTGDVLEVSADADDVYRAQLYRQQRLIAEMTIPPAAGFMMQKRFLPLPAQAANQPLDRIQLFPADEKFPHVIGHLFIYQDSFPQTRTAEK